MSFRVPEGVTLLPLEGGYVSDKCTNKYFNSNMQPYEVGANSWVSLPFVRSIEDDLWNVSIAKEGGGRCQWKLRSIFVSFCLSDSVALVKGRKTIPSSYLFDFIGVTSANTYSVGSAQDFKGDLSLETDFFPIVAELSDKETGVRLFGGDTNSYKWSRHFRLNGTKNIFIKPILHLSKSVIVTQSDKLSEFTAEYPDGSRENIPYIFPDYDKLLSMK